MSSYPNGRNNPEIFKGSLKANVLITDSEYQKRFISNLFQGKMVILSPFFSKKTFLIRKSHLVDFERLISKNLQRCSKVFLRTVWKNARLPKVLGLMGT